jgi:hypothetical protein
MNGYYSGVNTCSSNNNYDDNNYSTRNEDTSYSEYQPQTNTGSQPNCKTAGLVGGVMGGAAGYLAGNIAGAGAGYSLGSQALEDLCESNNSR